MSKSAPRVLISLSLSGQKADSTQARMDEPSRQGKGEENEPFQVVVGGTRGERKEATKAPRILQAEPGLERWIRLRCRAGERPGPVFLSSHPNPPLGARKVRPSQLRTFLRGPFSPAILSPTRWPQLILLSRLIVFRSRDPPAPKCRLPPPPRDAHRNL